MRSTRVLVLAALLSIALAAPAAAQLKSSTIPQALAKRGFGDRSNSYAWGMAWFKGKLYVGTGRDVMCVERATTDFYFPFAKLYNTEPSPGVRCPENPYDMDLRAEIWQFTPSTGRWKRVYRSPLVRNPRAKKKLVARDIAYRGMKVMNDRNGRPQLFVSGVTADEFLPELTRKHPPRLLRSTDGRHFRNVGRPIIVRYTGDFPTARPIGLRGLTEWNGDLYVLASTSLTGDGAVFRVDRPHGRRPTFKQVTPPSMHVFELESFAGRLYVGTASFDEGYSVLRTDGGKAPYRFKPVIPGGAGRGEQMVSVVSMHPFKGHLYVGGVSWYCTECGLPSTELIRIGADDSWDVVSGNTRTLADGTVKAPISGLPDGFGNIFNTHLWRMNDRDGALYVGTLDWSYLIRTDPEWGQFLGYLLNWELGYDVWGTCDGVSWFPVTRDAFGTDPADFGLRTLVPGAGGMFFGSANHVNGTSVVYDGQRLCGPPSKGARAASVAPRRLVADQASGGSTVLSWAGRAGARYRVERSEYRTATVGVRSVPGLPGSEPVPQVTAPGAAGSRETTLSVRGATRVLATTGSTRFVDRTSEPGVRYAYEVIGPDGTRSGMRIVGEEATP